MVQNSQILTLKCLNFAIMRLFHSHEVTVFDTEFSDPGHLRNPHSLVSSGDISRVPIVPMTKSHFRILAQK